MINRCIRLFVPSWVDSRTSIAIPEPNRLNSLTGRDKHLTPKLVQSARDKFNKSKRRFITGPCVNWSIGGGSTVSIGRGSRA
jgi:hypothetical protein